MAIDGDAPPPSYAEATQQARNSPISRHAPSAPEYNVIITPPSTETADVRPHTSTPAGDNPAETGAGHPDDAPPSYDSVFGHIREAKQSSTGVVDFMSILLRPVGCLVGLVLMLLMLGLMFGLPVTMIVVGSLYKNDCPVEPGIPIWLLVGGTIQLMHILYSMRSKQNTCLIAIFALFYFSWFIAGCVLVYPNFPPSYTVQDQFETSDYCHRTLFVTAFVTLILYNCVIGLLCCFVAM